MNEKPTRRLSKSFLLKLFVTLVLLAIIVWYLGGGDEVGRLIVRLHPFYIFLILIINTLDRSLMTFKWRLLLRGRNVHLPFFRGLQIYCASMVWGLFLPATVGADAVRAMSTSRLGLNINEILASIAIERIVGFLVALLLGLMSFVLLSLFVNLDERFMLVWWLGCAMTSVTIMIFVTSFSQKFFDFLHDRLLHRFRRTGVIRRLRELHATYQAYRHDKRNLVIFFVLTFIRQFVMISLYWLIAQALGIDVGFFFVAGALPLANLVARLPVSVNGWGVFDGVFMLLMSLANLSAAEAISIVLVARILQTVAWLPWWGSHMWSRTSQPLAKSYPRPE